MLHRQRGTLVVAMTCLLQSCASVSPKAQPARSPKPMVIVEARALKPDPAKLEALGLKPDDVQPPVAITQPQPRYPESALQARVHGAVELECVIKETGTVDQCRVVKGLHAECDAEAIRTVSLWRYTPTTLKGKPVAAYVTVTVRYHLEE